MRRTWILTKLLFCLCLALIVPYGCDCGNASSSPPPSSRSSRNGVGPGLGTDVTTQPSRSKTQVSAERPRIVAFGNSLTAGLGVPPDQSYPAHLQRTLDAAGYAYRVVNAGVSGDTTAGGIRRVSWVLNSKPAIVILELGGNDGLRGLPLDATRANLAAMTRLAKAAGAKVLILGMQLPPNYGRAYGDRFAALFADVARSEGAALVPFMLKGVADVPDSESLFQADRIHPVAAAHPTILANVWPVLAPLLK